MPVTYSIDPTARLVRLHYDGVPTITEATTVLLSVLADPEFRKGFVVLADRRGLPPASTQYVRRLASFAKAVGLLGTTRIAVVVDSTAAFGMARMGQLMVDGESAPLRIFTDIAEAETWLGVGSSPEEDQAAPPGLEDVIK
jgi:hypothetical protein